MKLSTRLVLLILGCLLPVLAAQLYAQGNLNKVRHEQLSRMILRQAELANADLTRIADGVRQFGSLIAQSPSLRIPGAVCNARLNAVHNQSVEYRFIALVSRDNGSLLCASDGTPFGASGARPSWLAGLLSTSDLTVGQLVSDAAGPGRFLPIAVPAGAADDAGRPRMLVIGLDVNWLQTQIEAARADYPSALAHETMMIADRDGTIVGQVPNTNRQTGQRLPAWLRPLVERRTRGVETLSDPAGHRIIAAYVPDSTLLHGLTVIDTLTLPSTLADIDRATYQDLLVIGGAALLAVMLAWATGRRFIYRPTESLMQAAQKWRDGDLHVRAEMTGTGSEFSALAQSFNAMAAGLQAREMERVMQASFLEAQVAERTRELSESNNRLQVEIAGREKTEVALHQAHKLQAVGQLAGGIAHDFNNMLATVLGNLELMERRVSQAGDDWGGADSERLQRLIERATGAVTRGGQLTSRLLAFSRRQRLTARPTDVNALLRELITLGTSTLGRRVQVVSELSDNLWPAMVDASQTEAAILNLCLNARDAMPDGGKLTIQTRNVTVEPGDYGELSAGAYVRVCIGDTGTGMSDEVKARAFEPFFTTKGPGAGSGLGLSQVYGMARQSDGIVAIDSTPGVGTQVILLLPRAADFDVADAAAGNLEATVPTMESEPILVVDDDPAVRQVTVEMARDLGCEVAQASGGEQALSLIGTLSPPPRLILLDYAMPGMNGIQLARALRARGVTAPIALVTGYAELTEADIAAEHLSGLLRKPFTIRELQGLLTELRSVAVTRQLEPGLAER